MSRSVTLLCLILSVGLVSSNHVDCNLTPEKCKHADSCESCGVHLLEKWAYCDSSSYVPFPGEDVETDAGEAGGSGVDTSGMKNCRLLDVDVADTFKSSMCDFCSGDCKYRNCKINTKHVRIIIGATGGTILLFLTIWIWCCCRKRGKKNLTTKKAKTEALEMKETKKREEKQDARRDEREDRLSGMRAKYGLKSNEDGYKDDLMSADDY